MRRVIVAALAMTPMLLHAQANSPAKTQSPSSSSTLQSKLVQPAELNGSAAGSTAPVRVTTGVGAPRLIYTVGIESDSSWVVPTGFTSERNTVVEMTVDAAGKPSNLKIVKSLGPVMDHNVLAAVGQYRFTPGTLDGAPTAVPVNLHVVLRTSGQ